MWTEAHAISCQYYRLEESVDEKSFLGTRARFQRLSDAKFFAGWVRDFSASAIIVTLSSGAPMEPGDEFVFEVHGRSSHASFPAVLSMVSADEFLFNIPQPMRLLTTTEEARVYVQDMAGVLRGDCLELDVVVIDVSRHGAGLLAPIELRAGERVTIQVDTPNGVVSCHGEVRYCRPSRKHYGHFRAGLLLDDMARIEKARWLNLVDQSQAA